MGDNHVTRFLIRRSRLLLCLFLFLALLTCIGTSSAYRFLHVSRYSETWLRARVDGAIAQGLDHLFRERVFARDLSQRGEPAVHHYLLDQVLELNPHAGLQGQMHRVREANERLLEWRAFASLPNWPAQAFDTSEKEAIKAAIRHNQDYRYNFWILHALHPEWTALPTNEAAALFQFPEKLRTSYDLTHAVVAYVWLKAASPRIADRLNIDTLLQYALKRIRRLQDFAPKAGDTYFERLAVLFLAEHSPKINVRWIERIIECQNADGGWTWNPSYLSVARELAGFHPGPTRKSAAHPTLLALYTLTHYRRIHMAR